MANKQIFLTDEGLHKLEQELEELKTVKRKEVAATIKVALSFGDLSENSEYDEAKNEQAMVEARIAESAKLGFTRCIIPRQNISSLSSPEKYGIQLIGIRSIWELIDILEPGKAGK